MSILSCSADHRNLHSFPTRRSSDLTRRAAGAPEEQGDRQRGLLPGAAAPAELLQPLGLQARRVRSEEHTSELQSHHDLVCRLLLEKKNKIRVRESIQQRTTKQV